jgi:hypothetical protein
MTPCKPIGPFIAQAFILLAPAAEELPESTEDVELEECPLAGI